MEAASAIGTARPLVALLVLLMAFSACDGGERDGDAGARDGAADGGVDGPAAAPPEIPWLAAGAPPIMLAPCPEGWREVAGGLVVECDPYPAGGAESCGAGAAHFPGEEACRPIGQPCPAEDYATELPGDEAVIFVKAGATPGGDGSRAAPFAQLSNVNWLSLGAGTTVALGKGTYEGTLPLRAGVTVVGACARDTVLAGLDGPAAAVVTVTSAGQPATVRNLAIVDAPQSGAIVNDGRSLVLEGVLVSAATGVGIAAGGAGTSLSISETVVRATRPLPDVGDLGRGLDIEWGPRVDASRLIVADNHDIGILAVGDETSVALSDVVVRDTRAHASHGRSGNGIRIGYGAHLDGTRVLLTGNREAGVLATRAGTEVVLTDSVVRGTLPRASDDQMGRGLDVESGSRFTGTRLLVADNHGSGIFAALERTTVSLSDVVVRDTQPEAANGGSGGGLRGQAASRIDATRMLVIGNHQEGALFAEPGTVGTFTDVAIRDTRPTAADGQGGRGVAVQMGAHFEGARLLFEGNREVSVLAASEGTAVELEDLELRNTMAQQSDGRRGHGLQVQQGARARGSRLRIDGARAIGLLASSGSVAEFADISIVHVREAACGAVDCPFASRGFGAAAVESTLSFVNFEVRDAAVCGVFLATLPTPRNALEVDLKTGVVAESAIGACIQSDGYDLDRLTDGVEYRDNGTGLESTSLPVPDVAQLPDL